MKTTISFRGLVQGQGLISGCLEVQVYPCI